MKNTKPNNKQSKTLMIVTIGVLIALHVVLSRFLSINAWNLKIGFAFVPVFVAAYLYGPIAAAAVGGLGDLVGALLFPIGAYFPGFTFNCAMTGVIMGILLYKKQTPRRVATAVAIDQLGLSLWLTTYWIHILYGSPYKPLLTSRLPQIAILTVVQFFSILALIKLLERMKAKQMMTGGSSTKKTEARRELRKSKVAARNALSDKEREAKSRIICENIFASDEFKSAKTILLYKWTKGEVRLEHLEELVAQYNDYAAEGDVKRLAYPLCVSGSEMIAMIPEDADAWQDGYYGIREPIREKSVEVAPQDLDLVVCALTVFDEDKNRMGNGAGFYDRYLPKAVNAKAVGAAFECQKAGAGEIQTEAWDVPMEAIFTEETKYE